MKAAFEKAGVDPLRNEFAKFLTKWLNHGRTVRELVEIAYELSGTGPSHDAYEGQPPFASARQPIGDGHPKNADKAILNVPSPEQGQSGARQLLPHGQSERAPAVPVREHNRSWPKPNEPTATDIEAMRKVRKSVAHSLWDRTIGGELRLRNSRKIDWINFSRKFHIGEHICHRMVTEIAWPNDDTTPLEKVATEKQVKDILESGPLALRMMELGHA